MEKEKLKQTQNCPHKKGFFRRYFGCMSGSNVTEESSFSSVDKPQPPHNAMIDGKTENQVTDCCTQSSEPTLKTLLVAPDSEKNKNDDIDVIYNTKHSPMNIERKEQLVKTILSKYLEVKRSENSKPYLVQAPKQEQTHTACMCPDKSNAERDIDVEYFSSDDSTVRLELPSTPRASRNPSKPKTDFPTKTKSAPTTSVTRDSLADICYKLYQFKQSDSSVVSNDTAKRKLELIFDQSYSEEMSSGHEDSSTISLQYKISCQRTSGTQRRPDSVLLEHRVEESSAVISRSKVDSGTSHELHMESSTKSAISAQNETSSSSLRWKLIISHHGDGT